MAGGKNQLMLLTITVGLRRACRIGETRTGNTSKYSEPRNRLVAYKVTELIIVEDTPHRVPPCIFLQRNQVEFGGIRVAVN